MRPSIIVATFTLVSALASLSGCSSGGDDGVGSASSASKSGADPVALCGSICAKVSECDRKQDKDTCENRCEKDLSLLTKLRADVVERSRACWETSDCREVLSSNRLKDCVAEAAVDTTPSDAAKEFCSAIAGGIERCDGDGTNRAECLSGFMLYSDETLTEGTKCAEKSCGLIADCLKAAF